MACASASRRAFRRKLRRNFSGSASYASFGRPNASGGGFGNFGFGGLFPPPPRDDFGARVVPAAADAALPLSTRCAPVDPVPIRPETNVGAARAMCLLKKRAWPRMSDTSDGPARWVAASALSESVCVAAVTVEPAGGLLLRLCRGSFVRLGFPLFP